MDGYVATDATNGLDDDWIMASPAPPSACASCGFFDDDDEHRAEFADRTDWADCVKCAEGDELMVFYEDCTGVCSPPAAKAYFEGFGFADLDASACIAHEPCGYEGYSLEGTVPPLETQLWSYSYEDDDPVDQSAADPAATGDEVAADCAAESRAVVGCWLDAGIPTDDDAAPIAYFEFLGETCAAAERSSEFRAMCANPKDGGESCEAAWTAYAECSYESRAREAGLACDLTCRWRARRAAVAAPPSSRPPSPRSPERGAPRSQRPQPSSSPDD
ncbi:vacuolar sorting protein 9 (VPS9) domain containing protein [Aureococcus anophagefferens]|nr:vacuolar sorting protein 9 (VPS9) domain containing protein [Aureococcus anophagefferens]